MKTEKILISQHGLSMYEKISICIIFMSDAVVMTGKYSSGGIGVSASVLVSAAAGAALFLPVSAIIKRCLSSIVFRFIIAVLSVIFTGVSLYVFSDFIKTCILPDTGIYIIPAAILASAFYSAFRSMNTLSRSVHIIMPLIILFAAAAVCLAATRARSSNIAAVFPGIITFPLISSAGFTFIFLLKEIMLLYLFSFSQNRRSDITAICAGTLIYGAVMSVMLITALAVLGAGLYLRLDYPLYYPLGLTGLGSYLERTEIISVIIFMILLVFKTGIFIRILFTACFVGKRARF